jgi:cytochrome c-type biogenesis protein CcmH
MIPECDNNRSWFTLVKNYAMQLKLRLWLVLCVCVLSPMLALPSQTPVVHAQQEQQTPVQPNKITEDQVNAVARELWCPLCSGVRLDACELKACGQMRQEIALRLAAGDDVEAIKKYFVTQYGPQVLGEPPRAGFNWLAWILPFAVLLAGAIFLVMRGRKLFFVQSAAVATPALEPTVVNGQDEPYVRRLEEELKRYD